MCVKLKELYENSLGKWNLIKKNLDEFNWENSDDFEISEFLYDLRKQIYSPCIFCFECSYDDIEGSDCSKCRIDKSICEGNGHFGLLGKIDIHSYNYFLEVQGKKDFIEALRKTVDSIVDALKKEYEILKS